MKTTKTFAAATAFKTILVFLAFSSLSLFADEPLPKGQYTLTSVDVFAIERTKTADGLIVDEKSNKLTHSIRFDVRPKFERVAGSEKKRFGILDPVTETCIKFDKPISFNGAAVPANTNLLKFKKFNGKTFNISAPNLSPLSVGSARIKRGFDIPNDVYSVTFEWKTKAGKTFSKEIQVTIDVDLP